MDYRTGLLTARAATDARSGQGEQRSAGALAGVAAALALALILSPAIRDITSELNNSLGRAWPFSMTYCHVRSSPGCDAGQVFPDAASPHRWTRR